jgi:hypothetical protein
MDTMNSIQARDRQRELRREADRHHDAPRTQVRRWVQLRHVFGDADERWGSARERVNADPACATC